MELARTTGTPLPDKIKNRPYLIDGLMFYWRAFWELSTDRDIGMGEGPIKWSTVNTYAIRHDVQGDEFDILVLIMKGMDTVYLEKRAAQNKKAMGKTRNKGKSFKKK